MAAKKPVTPEELDKMLEAILSEARSRFRPGIIDLYHKDLGREMSDFVAKHLPSFVGRKKFLHVKDIGKGGNLVLHSSTFTYEIPYGYFTLVFVPFVSIEDFEVKYPHDYSFHYPLLKVSFYTLMDVRCYFGDIFKILEDLEFFNRALREFLDIDRNRAKTLAKEIADKIRKRVLSSASQGIKEGIDIGISWKIKAIYQILSIPNRSFTLWRVRADKPLGFHKDVLLSDLRLYNALLAQFHEVQKEVKEIELTPKEKVEFWEEELERLNKRAVMGQILVMVFKFFLRYIEEVYDYVLPLGMKVNEDFVNDVLHDMNILNVLFEEMGVWKEIEARAKLK